MNKVVAKVWTFQSDSSSSKTYETLQYTDGSTSCNCMGWTRRVSADGSRSCKHTRLVDQNQADSEAKSFHDYNQPKLQHSDLVEETKQEVAKQVVAKQSGKKTPEGVPVVRKIRWK
jgi:hypothetical protein